MLGTRCITAAEQAQLAEAQALAARLNALEAEASALQTEIEGAIAEREWGVVGALNDTALPIAVETEQVVAQLNVVRFWFIF